MRTLPTNTDALLRTDYSDRMDALCQSIADELAVSMGRPDRVAEDCTQLRYLGSCSDTACLHRLLPLLRMRSGEIAVPLFELIEDGVQSASDRWPMLSGLLSAKDGTLARRALGLTLRLAERKTITVGQGELRFLAVRSEEEESPFAEPEALATLGKLMRMAAGKKPESITDRALTLLVEESDGPLRRLAARVLDLDGAPLSQDLVCRLLGAENAEFLAPYLAYTRATHLDLLSLLGSPASVRRTMDTLREAEAACGQGLLKSVTAELGWSRVNLGLAVRRYAGLSISGSLPLFVSPGEAALFEGQEEVRPMSECFVIIAQGGQATEHQDSNETSDPVTRFRAYNAVHAELLDEILQVSPLSSERTRKILERMDFIVEQFVLLFNGYSAECATLPSKYRELKERILAELELAGERPEVSAELTRLMQMFEDPGSLEEVRTLHGLKRYLHQRGLKLGFKLVTVSRVPNRTVDIVLADSEGSLHAMKRIRYADFDAPADSDDPEESMPYAVSVAVGGLVRQLLHGQETFPTVDIFCYGNEVHYYLAFRNHPAFLRIDYSPPLRGGMIDLEYYGVSNYEIGVHPGISMDAMRIFFEKLEFEIEIRGTRIHARYDKERGLDLQTLCEKAEALFCLAPYLMDVDWIIGSLKLDAEARRKVANAWAESFLVWGVLPVRQLLTSDRLGILERIETGPAGDREVAWSGEGDYRDRFSHSPSGFFSRLNSMLEALGIDMPPLLAEDSYRPTGELRLERCLFNPLREAVARGELVETPDGIARVFPENFQREHEVERFVQILNEGAETVAEAMAVARLIAPYERILTFRTTGSINGHEIQRTRLPLRGRSLAVYVLRDKRGMIALALFASGTVLFQTRRHESDGWISNASCDAARLALLLRKHNYTTSGPPPPSEDVRAQAEMILEKLRETTRRPGSSPVPSACVIRGLRAAPGRAVGTVIFGTANRKPQEVEEAVLVASVVRPDDNTLLYHSAGVVTTGGGVLSHAGLLATQFHKPALVISARWHKEPDGSPLLLYVVQQSTEETLEIHGWEAVVRHDLRERKQALREGDLVVVDADEGALYVLGRDHDALALHEGFRDLRRASRLLGNAAEDKEILTLRGRQLRARHLTEKVLGRLHSPVLAWHTVHELLLGQRGGDEGESRNQRTSLLQVLLNNPHAGQTARQCLRQIVLRLEEQCRQRATRAGKRIPETLYLHELLAVRLELIRRCGELDGASACLRECGIDYPRTEVFCGKTLDNQVRAQIEKLRTDHRRIVSENLEQKSQGRNLRHVLRQLERENLLLGSNSPTDIAVRLHSALASSDCEHRERLAERYAISSGECGFEMAPIVGWKAANLGELAHVAGQDVVPPWFAVTDKAFQETLQASPRSLDILKGKSEENPSTLRAAIDSILQRADLSVLEKSAQIRGLWVGTDLPESLAREVLRFYHELSNQDGALLPMVALRSSACEEDTETAARAGEFETYLFVSGEDQVLDYLKRTWSGLWTERAIHNRFVLGAGWRDAGGGVIVQRMVQSRVSGVLQTVNVAGGDLSEMVVSAGLGIGEGVVSGLVDTDHITVAKEGNLEQGNLHFRYMTNDKKEQVVFNRKTGRGTILTDTRNHERLRPALEYTELCDLVRIADRMERVYGYPLDIEFALEGNRLWILQVRPVTTFLPVFRETLERHPLGTIQPKEVV